MRQELCKICGEAEGRCDCSFALTNFFSLLAEAQSRVSSSEVTSRVVSARALIDKVEWFIDPPIPLSVIERVASEKNTPCDIVRLRDKRWYACIDGKDGGLMACLSGPYGREVKKIVANPSKFASYDAFVERAVAICGPEVARAKLVRVDLAVDYVGLDFGDLVAKLDARNKVAVSRYDDKSGETTGFQVGKGNEKLSVYNKQRQAKLAMAVSRVEVQLSGRKLPARTLGGLKDALLEEGFEPFGGITFWDLVPEDVSWSDVQRQRYRDLGLLIKHEGLFNARKKLNLQGNFLRDYGVFLLPTSLPDPSLALRDSLSTFFEAA